MENTFILKILTPEKEVFSGDVRSFRCKTLIGEKEFLAKHEWMTISVVPCIAIYKDSSNLVKKLFINKGIVNFKDNVLIVCSDSAEYPEDIDEIRAEQSKERAEERIKDFNKNDLERAKASLARAMVRLELKRYND